ncbi:class F sortase [Streptomyces sp. NPDC048248]|uniref:class F sortase n=1 Tax=Streptomyces sp. NPDC048248 TaxID=3365523 RepID=UPI003722FD96
MSAQQNSPRTTTAQRPPGRSLMWPAVAVGLGALLVYNSFETSADPKPQSRPPAAAASATPGPTLPHSAPTRLSIPEIAVDAPFTPLAIEESGQLAAPPADDNNLVGWFEEGASPGERGASIVAGHVDTKTGPAVFFQLSTLKRGSTVDIAREDGTVATFKVDSVETFSKANFPNDRVYADTPSAELRLITCGGEYDRKAKDYADNVVVFAHLASSKDA